MNAILLHLPASNRARREDRSAISVHAFRESRWRLGRATLLNSLGRLRILNGSSLISLAARAHAYPVVTHGYRL